jgi:beta-glucosidase
MQVYRPPLSRLDNPSWNQNLRNLVLVDDALNCAFMGRQAPAIALPAQRGYRLTLVDSHTPPVELDITTPDWQPTLLQLFIRSNPFRDSSGLIQIAKAWFHHLLQSNQLQALVIYGSPYILDQFLPALPADVPYVFSYGQMQQGQAIALQSLFGTPATPVLENGDREFTD